MVGSLDVAGTRGTVEDKSHGRGWVKEQNPGCPEQWGLLTAEMSVSLTGFGRSEGKMEKKTLGEG